MGGRGREGPRESIEERRGTKEKEKEKKQREPEPHRGVSVGSLHEMVVTLGSPGDEFEVCIRFLTVFFLSLPQPKKQRSAGGHMRE